MLKGKVSKILLFVVMSFCAFPMFAQNEAYNAYTPYSMFGIGEISKQGTAYNKSMGGVGIATRDKGTSTSSILPQSPQGRPNLSWRTSVWRRVTGTMPNMT